MEPIIAIGVIAFLASLVGRKKRKGGVGVDLPGLKGSTGPGAPPTADGPTPAEVPGTRVSGAAPDAFRLPEDFDPLRGLYITPDCVAVVEADGFWNGLDENYAPIVEGRTRSGFPITARNPNDSYGRDTLKATFAADDKNGALGFVDEQMIYNNVQPEEVAYQIVEEYAPMCASIGPDQWGPGLLNWYNETIERMLVYRQRYLEFGGFEE